MEGTHQGQDQGQLEGETETKDEDEAEGDIFSYGDQRPEVSRLISHEKIDSVRQCDEITEKGSQIEEKDCRQENVEQGCDPSGLEEGRKGSQELIEEKGDGKKKTCVKGQLEKGKKGLGDGEGHEFDSQVGLVDVTEQGFREWKDENPKADDHDGRLKEALA